MRKIPTPKEEQTELSKIFHPNILKINAKKCDNKNSWHSTKEIRTLLHLSSRWSTHIVAISSIFFLIPSAFSKPPSFCAHLLSYTCVGTRKLLLWNQSIAGVLIALQNITCLRGSGQPCKELKEGWDVQTLTETFYIAFETKWPFMHKGYKVTCSHLLWVTM